MAYNTIYIFIFIGIVLTAIVFLLNIYLAKYIIRRAISQVIKPTFQAKNLELLRHEWLGFFDHGNFKNSNFSPSLINGLQPPFYAEVFYYEKSIEQQVTVRIEVDFLSIRKVAYSRNI